jgi:hypothetical protein
MVREEKKMLHVFCGDTSANNLRLAGDLGDVIVWCDPLSEGPTPTGLSPRQWRMVRSLYLSQNTKGELPTNDILQSFREQQKHLSNYREHEEVVLWFDACLFDQIIMIRQLSWFSLYHRRDIPLSMICIGDHLKYPHFTGLGELTSEELANLLPMRQYVTTTQLNVAENAWKAYCSPNPEDLMILLHSDLTPLPYLREAILRHCQQFPSVENGLNRLENQILTVVAKGTSDLVSIFSETSAMEKRPFFGDTTLFQAVDLLASTSIPLLFISGPGPIPVWHIPPDLSPWKVSITPMGEQVLHHEVDWIELTGIDRWEGGVRLLGQDCWRWDDTKQIFI